jgi:hypothetical protein
MNEAHQNDSDALTFEEYMAEYGFPMFDDESEQLDDPDAVGVEIANQTIELIRQGLRQSNRQTA